jgi:hypothetical protein
MTRFFFPFALLSLLVLSSTAWAQDPAARPERPYRGVFAGGVGDAGQVLTINGSAGVSADDNVLAGLRSDSVVERSPTRPSAAGIFESGTAGAGYRLARDRFGLDAAMATTARYVKEANPRLITSRGGNLALSYRALTNTMLSASTSASYRPYYLLDLVPSSGIAVDTPDDLSEDVAISTQRVLTTAGSAGIEQTLHFGRRTTVSLDYTYSRRRISSRASDYQTQSVGGTLRRSLTKDLAVRAGYHLREYDYPALSERQALRVGAADAGVDFGRALSVTRRTTLQFSSGSMVVAGDRTRNQFRVIGEARLAHDMARTWQAGLSYGRNVRFVDSFAEPILYDAVTADWGGLITRRLQFTTSARATWGDVGLTGRQPYTAYVGSVVLSQALNRYLALSASYFYSQYHFDEALAAPLGVTARRERQGVRVSVTGWVPIFSRARTTNAAR